MNTQEKKNANEQIFEEAKGNMCNALMELMKDEFDAALNEAVAKEVAEAERRAEQRELENKLNLIRKKLAKGKSLEVIADELEEKADTIKMLYSTYLQEDTM